MRNELRIIAGQWRSRKLTFPALPELRPTPARVRETLFNWLRHDIIGARCLDLYAGSGALGFEAASRGAAQVVQVDQHPKVCKALKENIKRLGADRIEVVQKDVERFLAQGPPAQRFELAFLDPPFGRHLAVSCCQRLERYGWLLPGAKIYVEAESRLRLAALPENWRLLSSKKAGEVGYHLLCKNNSC